MLEDTCPCTNELPPSVIRAKPTLEAHLGSWLLLLCHRVLSRQNHNTKPNICANIDPRLARARMATAIRRGEQHITEMRTQMKESDYWVMLRLSQASQLLLIIRKPTHPGQLSFSSRRGAADSMEPGKASPGVILRERKRSASSKHAVSI